MGKENFHVDGIISYTAIRFRARAALSLSFAALVASCATGRPDHFAGSLQPQAGTCDPPSRAALTLNDAHVVFTPHEGVVALDGVLAADGSIRATTLSNGMDRTPYRQTFVGSLAGDRVTGSYTTPRCRYTVTLTATAR